MVARGETIGRAVVKIIADGDDFGKQIERDLEKAEGPIRASGRRASDAYSEEFNKRMSQKDIGKSIRDSLEKGIAKSDVSQAYFNSRDWKRFQGLLHKRFGDLGDDAGRSLSTEFAHNLDGLTNAVEGIFGRIERLRGGGDIDLGNATLNVVVAEDLDKFLAKIEALRTKVAATGGDIDLGDATMHVRVAEDDDFEEVLRHLRSVGDEVDEIDRRGGRVRRTFTGFGRLVETIGTRVERGGGLTGRIFGKGSRNDFFNIVGSIVGGLTTAAGTLVRFAGEATSAFSRIGTGAREASGILERFGTTVSGAFASFAANAPAIALAFAVIIAAVATATAAFSLLAGAITALAGSLAFAIVGALAPIAGLIGPVALVITGVVAGLATMNKAAKKTLKEAVKPLIDGFKELGRQVRIGFIEGLRDTGGIDAFAQTLRDLRPLFRIIGESIATMLGQFGNLTRGKAFQDFVSTMERTLPTTMRRLGAIFTNVLGGILNVFTVLNQPGGPVSQFLVWLQRITREFLDWSNTKKGRDSIAGFFDKAVESAKAWGGLLLAAGRIIGDLFAKGRGTGDNIVTSLTDALNEFGDWLEDPANQKAIQQWFADSKTFADNLGDLALAFADLADAADDPNTRKNVEAIMKALTLGVNLGSVAVKLNSIALAMEIISGVKAKAPDIFGALEDFGASIGGKLQPGVEAVKGAVDDIIGFFQGLGDPIGQVVGNIVGFFAGLPGKIGSALSGIGSAIAGVADSIVGFFAAIPGRIGAALSGIGSSVAGVVGRIVGFFASLPGQIVAAVAPIPGRVNAFFDQLLFNIGFTVGRIVRFFITLPGQIIAALAGLVVAIRGRFNEAASNVPGVIDRIVGFFRSLPGRIGRAIAGVAAIIRAQFGAALGRVQGIVERIVGFFRSLPGRVGRAIASVAGIIRARFADAAARIPPIVARIVAFFAALPGRVGRAISAVIGIIRSRFAEAASRIPAIVSRIVGFFAALPGRISNAIGNLWGRIAAKFQAIPGNVAGVVSRIVGEFAGLAGRILSAIGTIDIGSLVRFPAGKVGSLVRGFIAGVSASGGIFTGAQTRIIGEAGPEAIVPLNRPLSQVDPAVRQLSAIAQGLTMASGGVVGGPSRVVNVGGLTVITPTKNPTAVAVEAVNRLVAVGY
jgi:phage-related protein